MIILSARRAAANPAAARRAECFRALQTKLRSVKVIIAGHQPAREGRAGGSRSRSRCGGCGRRRAASRGVSPGPTCEKNGEARGVSARVSSVVLAGCIPAGRITVGAQGSPARMASRLPATRGASAARARGEGPALAGRHSLPRRPETFPGARLPGGGGRGGRGEAPRSPRRAPAPKRPFALRLLPERVLVVATVGAVPWKACVRGARGEHAAPPRRRRPAPRRAAPRSVAVPSDRGA